MTMTTSKNCGEPLTPAGLSLKSIGSSDRHVILNEMSVADCKVEIHQTSDSLWVMVKRNKKGGFALRAAHAPGEPIELIRSEGEDRSLQFQIGCSLGQFDIRVVTPNSEEASIRCTVDLTPNEDLSIPYWSRDLFPIDEIGDPASCRGSVRAAQRGLNAGLVYLTLYEPAFGSIFYFQNFTALNDYFRATGTIPDGRVGGNWPELGYSMPPSTQNPLLAGKRITISDAFIGWTEALPDNPLDSARIFIDLFATVYRRLDRQATEYHDWPSLAEQTLRDLKQSPKASLSAYGHTYLHPYTNAEYPDSMVQLTVLMTLREYATFNKDAGDFANDLLKGVPKFFDSELGSLRRYLPNVGKDKDKDAVDSWYLYHPMANLGRLAAEGDERAKKLFLISAEYGIKAARHFRYKWPIQYNVQTFDIIKADRKPGDPGQSDTGGLYAYVMLQAFELTSDQRFLNEAIKAIEALRDMQFELEYQANITGWSANACLRLFLITGEQHYLDQSYVFLAGLFHNSVVWESTTGYAGHYRNFLAPTCLHDGPYVALYECYECFAAFHEYLTLGKTHINQSVRMLLAEFCKYALTRAWYFYPAHLPEYVVSSTCRNGEIDRALAFPLEDLYADGQPAGQVGQEIYGSGAAFAFVTRSYHELKKNNATLYCEYPIFDLQELVAPCIAFRVRGVEGFYCRARLIPGKSIAIDKLKVCDGDGRSIRSHRTPEGHWEFTAPASKAVEIRWGE
jgi:hypothetical protein